MSIAHDAIAHKRAPCAKNKKLMSLTLAHRLSCADAVKPCMFIVLSILLQCSFAAHQSSPDSQALADLAQSMTHGSKWLLACYTQHRAWEVWHAYISHDYASVLPNCGGLLHFLWQLQW